MKTKLASKVLEGDVRAAARLMRDIEDEMPYAAEELDAIYPHTGRAYIVGMTGSPGVGKSTLVDNLIDILRKKEMTIGVVAIDPTSPFTGGAILGDRVRMQQYGLADEVFIRSMATRGWVGGLSKATIGMIHVMDAMGKDIILVETVGAGQSEVDIARVADTSIVVLSPASGDEMQMIKAGIMEIADIFVVNKADRGGADNIVTAIEFMLGMKTYVTEAWKPKIILTEAINNKGAGELAEEIIKHREFMVSSGDLVERRKERAKLELIEAINSFVKSYCYGEIDKGGELEKLVDDIARRKTNPHSAAVKIINEFSRQFKPSVG
ncbi:methylmalonyl Co-A mutase-associated GTPase MeaB [Chloroflexota bacterium]